MGYGQAAAISRIAMVATDVVHGEQGISDIAAPLRELAEFDAMMISSKDPFTGAHKPVLNIGYNPSLLAFLNQEYLRCPSYRTAAQHRRPMRMRDFGDDFFRTRVYEEYLNPIGYQEGVTLVLRAPDSRITGLLTMSFANPRDIDEDARVGVELVSAALGRLSDFHARPRQLASGIDSGASSYLVDRNGSVICLRAVDQSGGDGPFPECIVAACAVLENSAGFGHQVCGVATLEQTNRWQRARILVTDVAGHRHALILICETESPLGLTLREVDVTTLVAVGLSNKEIGERLHVSPRTVSTHVEHILGKVGITNRTALASLAVREGILRLSLLYNHPRGYG